MLCADTSFLFSLYLRDTHTTTARRRLITGGQPLVLSALNEYELGNALRLAEFRGMLQIGDTEQCIAALAKDQIAGRWRRSEISLDEIVIEATRLSLTHTVKSGHRAFDILHVAHACLVKPKLFLSFDTNQLQLAKSVGLRC